MEPKQSFIRLVIGCFDNRENHWLARKDLSANGLHEDQVCSLGSRKALLLSGRISTKILPFDRIKRSLVRFQKRHIKELDILVSAPHLFDILWPESNSNESSVARWLTANQSDVIWRKLREDCPVLIVSADSAQQHLESVQIQLAHRPTVVQTFNFAG